MNAKYFDGSVCSDFTECYIILCSSNIWIYMSTENFEGRCVIVHRNFQGKQKHLKRRGSRKLFALFYTTRSLGTLHTLKIVLKWKTVSMINGVVYKRDHFKMKVNIHIRYWKEGFSARGNYTISTENATTEPSNDSGCRQERIGLLLSSIASPRTK